MDMEEKKLTVDAAEQALPVQELPADIPAEVRQRMAGSVKMTRHLQILLVHLVADEGRERVH